MKYESKYDRGFVFSVINLGKTCSRQILDFGAISQRSIMDSTDPGLGF